MHTTDKYAKGGMLYDLKQDDYVWNEVGKKLIVDKVTKDEYYLTSFGQSGASPFSKSKVNSYLKSGKWSLKPKKQEIMANGGNVETALQNFDVDNLDAFEKYQYDMLFNRIGKEQTLRILINNVEGDYSQLSPKLRALAKKYKLSQGITMAKGGNLANYRKGNMAKGGKIKPKMVRTQFEEEEFDYGKGGAIYKGDKVKIKDSSKKMVVKDISKGRKGYVEFSGDAGTYLKGDLEKMAKGGEVPVENSKMLGKTITIQLPTEVKPFKDKVIIEYGDFVMGNKGFWSKEYIVKKSEDGGTYLKGDLEKMAKGGYIENLQKELYRLQKELNSSRLRTYTEGDSSEEEQQRKKERASKLARFNQILELLKEDRLTGETEGERRMGMDKMAKGGSVSKSEKEKLSNLAYQLQNADDGWIKNNHGKFVEMQNEYKKQFKKVYGHTNYTDPNEMAKGGYTMPNNCWCYEIGGL